MTSNSNVIAVVGLGYVGLPLAVEFGKKHKTIGFDTNASRIKNLMSNEDVTGEVSKSEFQLSKQLSFTNKLDEVSHCNRYVICVPTPINDSRDPDFSPLISASTSVGRVLKKNDIVIYESTVYPGATEEICIPVLEQISGLKFNKDFFVGYSPERINPGDKLRPITKIKKVTSGSTPEVANIVNELYLSIIEAGTHLASSIKVAEASKIIENVQRDVNIALMNELAQIFSRIGIDTTEVLKAAETKWNFVRVRPGLVGGHCIGVDPYYLLKKSISHGYVPDIIQSSRKINEGFAEFAANRLIKKMCESKINVGQSRVLVLGATFKENCTDTRNTKVADLVLQIKSYGATVEVYDSWANIEELHEFVADKILANAPEKNTYDAVVLAVAHNDFVQNGANSIRAFCKKDGVFFDLKSAFEIHESDLRL